MGVFSNKILPPLSNKIRYANLLLKIEYIPKEVQEKLGTFIRTIIFISVLKRR